MIRVPVARLFAALSLAITAGTLASESRVSQSSVNEPPRAQKGLTEFEKEHGHEHARLCSREKCIDYCDELEMDSHGGLLRRLRRECRKDCMEGCNTKQDGK